MQLLPISFDENKAEKSYSDYLPQGTTNNGNALFSAKLEQEYYDKKHHDEKEREKEENRKREEEKRHLYSTRAEVFSFFAPQEPRFNKEELGKLGKAFQVDNISLDAQNALADIANSPTGPTLKELLTTLSQSVKGGNIPLNSNEISYLQNFTGRANPESPTMLYDAMRFSDALTGMQALLGAMKKNPTTMSKEELSAIAKALNLPEDMQKGMQKILAEFDPKKPLNPKQMDELFGEAKAYLQGKADEFEKMQKSLEKNMKPLMESAQKREEEERRAIMRENKEVLYSKTLIEDTVTTKVMGNELNRTEVNGKKLTEKEGQNKSALANGVDNNEQIFNHAKNINEQSSHQSQALVENPKQEKEIVAKSPFEYAQVGAKEVEQKDKDNTLIANRVFDERNDVKSAEKEFITAQNKEKENAKESFEHFNDTRSGQNHDPKEASLKVEPKVFDSTVASFAGSFQPSQISYAPTQANFADATQNLKNQVQDSVLTMMKNGAKRLEVSLNPLELGQLSVALTVRNGEVNAVIQAEKAESASLINQQLDAIKHELENQGFKVQNIEVEVGLSNNNEPYTGQDWQGMQQHNNEQAFKENLNNLNYLRALTRQNSASESTLAHNMQHTGSIVAGKEINSEVGLHIIT